MAYTSAANVAAYLGLTLTTTQTAQATALLPTIQTYIDTETRRTWTQPPITGEIYDLPNPYDAGVIQIDEAGYPIPSSLQNGAQPPPTTIYLLSAPVASIELVQVRTRLVGDVPLTLQANIDYELQNPTTGELVFGLGYGGPSAYALVSYTPLTPLPTDVALAATMLLAHWLRFSLFPERFGVQTERNGQRAYSYLTDIPDDVTHILRNARRTIIG